MNEVLNYVLSAVCNPTSLIMVLAGTCMGLIFGSLPGLSATMAVALLIPMTLRLSPFRRSARCLVLMWAEWPAAQ